MANLNFNQYKHLFAAAPAYQHEGLPYVTQARAHQARQRDTRKPRSAGVLSPSHPRPPASQPPPPATTTTPCPTVTKKTSSADCSPIRCPVPTCEVRSTLNVPCGCTVKTLLYVQGCATTCFEGCSTCIEAASMTGC
ncbi:hypothetical protein B0T13DRAFT_236674 [Neurospora crassa]|nr:hypothetical protein B0T13DRAFT_236674 [Neurospora crassa]